MSKVDLAISYEPELFFAATEGLPVVAVASVIPVPLNSLLATADSGVKTVADLKGRKVGVTGIPTTDAFLRTMLKEAGVDRADVKAVNVGFNLEPAILSGKADAVLGAYRNVEAVDILAETGEQPTVIPVDEAGVPSFDELVLVANSDRLQSEPEYAEAVKRFVAAFVRGTEGALADPDGTLEIMKKVTDYKPEFLEGSVPATLELVTPPGGRPIGCLDLAAWQSFGAWMLEEGLLKEKVDAATVMSTDYLPYPC